MKKSTKYSRSENEMLEMVKYVANDGVKFARAMTLEIKGNPPCVSGTITTSVTVEIP